MRRRVHQAEIELARLMIDEAYRRRSRSRFPWYALAVLAAFAVLTHLGIVR